MGAKSGRAVTVGVRVGMGVREGRGEGVSVGCRDRVRVGRGGWPSVAEAMDSTVGVSAAWQAVNINVPKRISDESALMVMQIQTENHASLFHFP